MTNIPKKFFKNLGKKGGAATLKKHGKDHFKRLAMISAANRKQRSEEKKKVNY